MTNNMPSGAKSIVKHQTRKLSDGQNVFLPFLFRQASSKLLDFFMMVFAWNCSILHWAVHQPIAFSQLWSLMRHFELVAEELWLHLRHHFLHTCTMQARRLILSWGVLFLRRWTTYIHIIDSELCVMYWQCNNFSFLQHAFIKQHQWNNNYH